MNPYYLRLDLDGDRELDYVAVLLSEDQASAHTGLIVCFSNGKKVVYRGMSGRLPAKERALKENLDDNDESLAPPRIAFEGVLTETYTSQGIAREIEIGSEWMVSTQTEIRDALGYYGIPVKFSDIMGEAIGSIWETTETIGFLEKNRFRWFILTINDYPILIETQ